MQSSIRILCLGNELLADDAFGAIVAQELKPLLPPSVDVVFSPAMGLALLDFLQDVQYIFVVDAVQTGTMPPGGLHVCFATDVMSASGPAQHYVGLFETLALAKELLLPVPEEVVVVMVEVADCLTVGGPMSREVRTAIPTVVNLISEIIEQIAQSDLPGGASPAFLEQVVNAVSSSNFGEGVLIARPATS